MKKGVTIAVGLLFLATQGVMFTNTASAQSSPLDQTATVKDVKDTKPNPCQPNNEPGEKYSKYFGLKPNKSKFNVVNRDGLRYRINVKALFRKEIEKPDFYLFNTGTLPITADPCTEGGDISKHFYAFSVHDLINPEDKKLGPHALIYIPLDFKLDAPPKLADEFHLVVLTIESDANKCEGEEYEDSQRARCRALNKIYKTKADAEPAYKFIAAVEESIGDILPPTRSSVPAARQSKKLFGPLQTKFHNGVIHGTL
jgi:hypothetical protein